MVHHCTRAPGTALCTQLAVFPPTNRLLGLFETALFSCALSAHSRFHLDLIASTEDVAVYRSLPREGPPAPGSRLGGVDTQLPTRSMPCLLRMRTRRPRVSALQSSCMRKRILMLAKVSIQFYQRRTGSRGGMTTLGSSFTAPSPLVHAMLGRIRSPTPLVRCRSCPVAQFTHVT